MRVSEATIETKDGSRVALLVTPDPVVVGRARLEALRKSTEPGALDRRILDEVRRQRGRVNALIIRGTDWHVDPSLDVHEREELGLLLTRSQLPTYRRFLSAGMVVVVHAEFGPLETEVFRRGAEHVIADIEASPARSDDVRAIQRVDLFNLKHLCFFFSLSIDRFLTEVLPPQLKLFETRAERIRDMLDAVPPASIA
ncbi:MAG: hypothetical protein ACXWUG_17210 [Polyangiales bacterium]